MVYLLVISLYSYKFILVFIVALHFICHFIEIRIEFAQQASLTIDL